MWHDPGRGLDGSAPGAPLSETSVAVSSKPGLTWRRMLGLNFGVTCAVTLVFWSFKPDLSGPGLLATFALCLAFTNGFGIPAAFVMTRLGRLASARPPPYDWIAAALQIFTLTAVGTLLGVLALHGLGIGGAASVWTSFWAGLRFAVVVGLTVGLGMFFWEGKKAELAAARREIERRDLAEARALKLLAESRLASLESRIHPHFLFNTLNSIAALIPDDPRRAEETVQRLAALLRFSLEASRQRLVPLAQELQVVRDYLEIEAARFGPRLRHAVELEPDAQALLVPPLSVQTLVENAVKHAVAPLRGGATLHVRARVQGGDLVVDVRDDGPGFTLAVVPPGHGIDTLQQRLQSLYGERADLALEPSEGGGATLRLRLPARAGDVERA